MKKILTLLALIAICSMFAMAVSAEVTVTYDLTQEATDDGASSTYVITATVVNPDAAEFQIWYNKIEFDNTIIVPADYYDGSVVDLAANPDYCIEAASYTNRGTTYKATIVDPYWSVNGSVTTHEFDTYYGETTKIANKTGLAVFKFYFNFAAGKSEADFEHDSFKVVSARYVDNDVDYYYNREGHEDNMTIINNVVPAPTVITISVKAGDIVYLQDGTKVNIAETNEAYVLTADVGYVAVNTGYDAQKTYYINGTSAELVHTDAVLGSELYSLRDRTPVYDAVKGEEIDKNGLRFQMLSSQSSRKVADPHDVVEAGFLMTAKVQKVVDAYGESPELTHDKVESGLGLVKKGVAYDPANGIDIRMGSDDEIIDIRGVFYNIPINQKNVTTTIISRPYYKVGNTYVYGEASETTLYDVAAKIKDGGYEGCTGELRAYIDEIIECVEGEETPIVEDEVIIDISGLYGSN